MTTMNNLKTITFVLASLPFLGGSSLVMAENLAQETAVSAPAHEQDLDRIVAVVNNDVITERELEERVHTVAMDLRRQNLELPPMGELRRQVLDRLITEHTILQRANETGIRIDDGVVNATIEQIAAQNKLTVAQLREHLHQDGVPFSAFREDIRHQIITQRLREREVDSKITIPESEVDAFLAEQAGFLGEDPTEYHVAHILLPIDQPANAPLVEKEAQRILGLAKKGENFNTLAVSYSKADDALSGGDLGWRVKNKLPTDVWKAIEGQAKTGSVFAYQTANAWHIVKLLGKRDGIEHKLSAGPVERTHVRHILMTPSDITPEAEVIHRLTEIRQRLVDGKADFATMARLNSVDGSATRGGDLGWVEPGDTVPEFEKAMNALKPGEISPIIHTPFGYHIIQVEGRQVDKDGSPERLRIRARQALREKKLAEAAYDWERKLRDEAYLDIREDVSQPHAQ